MSKLTEKEKSELFDYLAANATEINLFIYGRSGSIAQSPGTDRSPEAFAERIKAFQGKNQPGNGDWV